MPITAGNAGEKLIHRPRTRLPQRAYVDIWASRLGNANAIPNDAFGTPRGDVPLDQEAIAAMADLPFVSEDDAPHAPEHALEVELPFLQLSLRSFALVPLVVGEARPQEVAQVLARLWGGPETLV